MKTQPTTPKVQNPAWPALVGLVLAVAGVGLAAAETNQPPPRLAVAVLCWLPEDPAALAAQDWHWLRTFDRLVSDELRHVAALRVISGQAVEREAARHKLSELKPDEAARTNAVLGLRRMGENLRASWLVVGALARTGVTWTAHTRLVDARSGQSRERFTTASTNWFELRDQVVKGVLRHLGITPSPEEAPRMGKPWTVSSQALEWFSRADNAETSAETLELCKKALAEDPGFIQARGLLAATLFNLGRDEEALSAAREALRQQPDKSTAARLYLLTANILLMQQQVTAEQQAVAEGLRLCPDLADLLALQAGLHERVRDFDAAAACLRRAIESDPGNPRLYAWLGQVQAKQGSLTNALASLEHARQLLADIPAEGSDDIELSNIELALAEAYASVGNLAEALQHYRRVLAEARDAGLGEARVKWVEETVRELERRSEPVPVAAEKPRQFLPGELQTALRERLTAEEVASAVNPLAATPEMVRWARELVAGAESDLARARKLFDTLAARPKAAGAGTRTAQEVFAAWNDLDRVFVCQEYAELFVALARSADLPAFYVHVERDYSGRVVDHDCAVVFAEGKAWLVDPTYAWFGVPHREFRVLDDLQTIAHHAFQPHGGGLDAARCRAGCKLDPDFAWGRINLVLALIQTNKLGEARTELDLVRRSAPDYWRGLAAEGFLAFKQEQFDRAVEWLQRAVKANPDHADARLLLGEALFRTGQHTAAREQLLAGLRRSFRPGSNNEVLGRKTLALLEEALGSDSNTVRTAKSRRDAAAYHNLGVSFLSRPSPDYASAAKWFRKAAELGDPQAQLVLGMLHWTGRGVLRAPVRAVYWWRKSAEGGDPVAMRNLGLAYSRGVGVERNLGQALNWLRRAAEGGDLEAQAALGKACYEGRVVPKNLAEALAWLTLATEADAKSPGVKIEDSQSSSALRQARHLLREVELFASPEEKAAARAKVDKFKASRAIPGAAQRPVLPLQGPPGGDLLDGR